MADYFSEYASFVGSKGLPSPVDTPYETPGYIRSKRSSRATASSSREQSASPPPLPPDATDFVEKSRDGRYSALDPRRFTPTLHASLVSEILSLRRELDSKNNLVENLETSLASAKTENETLTGHYADQQREARKAKKQISQMEKGTYDAVEALLQERDVSRTNAEDLNGKLDAMNKRTRRQDEDAARTQAIWDQEKESWENERRQLERRVHVTENRLRTVVDEITTQQVLTDIQGGTEDESMFKDSGLGHESDTASVQSATPIRHRRNVSSISFRPKSMRNSVSTRASAGTPEPHGRPNGYSLADELGIDEEDEYDIDEFEHADDELDYAAHKRRTIEIRRGSIMGDMDSKAKRVLGLTTDISGSPLLGPVKPPNVPESPTKLAHAARAFGPSPLTGLDTAPVTIAEQLTLQPRPVYVDSGYQPSPPPSPQHKGTTTDMIQIPTINEPVSMTDAEVQTEAEIIPLKRALGVSTQQTASPISPPETPVIDGITWPEGKRMSIPAPAYSDAATQTVAAEPMPPSSVVSKRDSLSPPSFVPAIAIHPPTSRPSSPQTYVLPPGTKNASTQAALPWPGKDASMQTEEIRVDKRLRRLPSLLQPSRVSLLPSPTLAEFPPMQRAPLGGTAKIFTQPPLHSSIPSPPLQSPPLQSPIESSPEAPSNSSAKNQRDLPLRAIPLGRPVLAPVHQPSDVNDGPLHRSSQYGVTRPLQSTSQLAGFDHDSDESEYEDPVSDAEPRDLMGSIPAFNRAPHGRFALSGPPKVVPEDKEISPDRRPGTAESYGAAPAPSVASSRGTSQRTRAQRPPAKLNSYKDPRSRSPSFGSVASSSYSAQPALPPFPIPRRSSSRVVGQTGSEGSQSPTPQHAGGDIFGRGGHRALRTQHVRQNSLRKVQSATVIRSTARGKSSPQKRSRRKRSADLKPIQALPSDGPTPTRFPIPALPTPLQERPSFDMVKGSVDLSKRPTTATTVGGRNSEEGGLVDAIAATMVGEWMWKYIRKRKSFGMTEEAANDFPHESVNGAVSITNHGTRHKRWVWLSPYERTIMWDTKQPTSGTALLGKKGRKLTIQSVLDVQDNSPLPKGAELSTAFDRSILILTPERALKFTAVSRVRHELWMTALAFLAESGRLPQQFPVAAAAPPSNKHVPPPMPLPEVLPRQRQRSPSFGRATIRDSVRLAKGKRPVLNHNITDSGLGLASGVAGDDAALQDPGADFPAVPRLYISTAKHRRKRSNTSPRLPPPLHNLRSISSSAIPSSGTSSRLHPLSTNGSSVRASSSSKSGSRQDSIASPDRPNFFEAVGTVRMEAFVDPNVRDGVLYVPAPPPVPSGHHGPRKRRGDSNFSVSTFDKRRAGFILDENGIDPFKGF